MHGKGITFLGFQLRAGSTISDRIFSTLRDVFALSAIGYRGALSIELFNRQYWAMDPLDVARTGLQKLRAAVRAALAA